MRQILLIFIWTIYSASIYCQVDSNKLWISGHIKVEIAHDIVTPIEATIEITPIRQIMISDSFGHFRYDGLKPGKYNLKVLEYGFNTLDTFVILDKLPINDLSLVIKSNCPVNRIIAENDIKNGKIKLLLVGSVAPIANSKHDLLFQDKYKVFYYDYGCDAPAHECITQYNEKIFNYLDSKFDKQWRNEVRKDVIGLK
jgi:hypothetical protein